MGGPAAYSGKEKPLAKQMEKLLRSNPETPAYRDLKASLTKDAAKQCGDAKRRAAAGR